jgi:hypothetical protein
MSWWPVIALCLGAYGLKLAGVLLAGKLDPEAAERWSLEDHRRPGSGRPDCGPDAH